MRVHSVVTMCLWLPVGLAPAAAWAKGMDQLTEQNPEKAEAKAAVAATPAPSELSKSLADKLSLATSFSWVKASRAQGSWQSGGMSDVTLAYHVASLGLVPLAMSYRFAPVAVTGKIDARSYRGIWEGHYLGARFGFPLAAAVTAHANAELGYVAARMRAVDGLEALAKHSTNGALLAVGGGVDVGLVEKSAFTLGPRASLGFGKFSIFQLGAAASYAF